MCKVSVVIVAGGKGRRMGAKVNKVFLTLGGKPLLYHTLKNFSQNKYINEIIVVTAQDETDFCFNEIIKKYNINKVSAVISGGIERQDSVYNGLKALKNCDIVLIHDGARPFVNDRMIEEGIKNAKDYGACACGVKPKDTMKVIDKNNFSEKTVDRESLFIVQTPQCFKYDIIMQCHKCIKIDKLMVTDDTSIVENYGYKVFLYEGSYNNIKITTPEDLAIGEEILKNIDSCI